MKHYELLSTFANVVSSPCQISEPSDFVQENTCLIDENCYFDGEINPQDPLQRCNATQDATAWSDIGEPT